MKTIYENNIEQLKISRTQLYNKLINYKENEIENENNIFFESFEAKDGTKILSIEVGGKNYRLNSNYNPILEADKWVKQYNFNNSNCVIPFFGLGNGIFVRSLIRNINNDDKIIIYEPSIEIFKFVIREFDISDILENENVYILIKGINENEFRPVLDKNIDWSNLSSQMLCFHPFYNDIFTNDYKNFLNDIRNNNTQIFINRNTAQLMGKDTAKNTIHNFKYIKSSNILSELNNIIPNDIPAIIVAAGPSLEKNIHHIKDAKNKSIIFATDRALDFLLNHNIEPDFVVTLDPIKPVKYFSIRDNIETPLFCKIESNKDILDYHKGRKIWFDSHPYFNKLYEELGKELSTVNSGGSVATAAFSICIELKIKKIILVGQDLAYSGEYTHAGGIVGNGVVESSIAEYVEDIYGNMIPTRYDWKYFKLWFEDAISNFAWLDVIDATEGGAKIKGTKVMTLKDAISEYCIKAIDCKEIMKCLPYTFDSEDFKTVQKYIEQSKTDLDGIFIDSKELVHISKKLLKASENKLNDNSENEHLINKLSQINENIINKPIYSLIDTYISDLSVEYLSGVYSFTGEIHNDQTKTYYLANKIYEAIGSASKELKDLFEKSYQ